MTERWDTLFEAGASADVSIEEITEELNRLREDQDG